MSNLRKAAELVLEAYEKPYGERAQALDDAIEVLSQALLESKQDSQRYFDGIPEK